MPKKIRLRNAVPQVSAVQDTIYKWTDTCSFQKSIIKNYLEASIL